MVFIIMEQELKIVRKLLDNFIMPKFEDIFKYELKHRKDINGDKVQIEFLMDGTEQDIEEEIVEECYNLLKYYDLPNLRLSLRFTTDGENFYDYN
jgi:hypothetical protein